MALLPPIKPMPPAPGSPPEKKKEGGLTAELRRRIAERKILHPAPIPAGKEAESAGKGDQEGADGAEEGDQPEESEEDRFRRLYDNESAWSPVASSSLSISPRGGGSILPR